MDEIKPNLIKREKIAKCYLRICLLVMAVFTLLLIVPQYSDYTGKAQASEAYVVTQYLRQDIAAYYFENKVFPEVTQQMFVDFKQTQTNYFSTESMMFNTETGTISITFNKGENNHKKLILIPTLQDKEMIWRCSGTLKQNNFPSACFY